MDYSSITIAEMEERIAAGDLQAKAFWDEQIAPIAQRIFQVLVRKGEAYFEGDPAKPFFEGLRSMYRSENPVIRAIVRAHDNWTLADVKRDGGKRLQAELAQSAKLRPDPLSTPARGTKVSRTASAPSITVKSGRTEGLNRLAVLWVLYNQTERGGRYDGMEWFLENYAPIVGLKYVSMSEFKKYLPKARKAGLIDKDERARRYIPRLGT